LFTPPAAPPGPDDPIPATTSPPAIGTTPPNGNKAHGEPAHDQARHDAADHEQAENAGPAPGNTAARQAADNGGDQPRPASPAHTGPSRPAGSDTAVPAWLAESHAPLAVSVFGPLRIYTPTTTGGRVEVTNRIPPTGRDLLGYLAVHPGGASLGQIADALWPHATGNTARRLVHPTLTKLRNRLRDLTTTATTETFIERTGDQYRLTPALIDTDHARFTTAITTATRLPATDPHRLTALHTASDLATGPGTGPLLDGNDTTWAAALRQITLHQTLDTLTLLADTLEPDNPTHALTVVTRMIDIDPYTENHYQHAMRLHAELGHHDPITRLLRTLEYRLAGLDTTPSTETTRLVNYLHRQLTTTHPNRKTS